MADVAAFVLAGGKSSRMGRDKAFLQLDGRTLLERAIDLAHTISEAVRIVGAHEKFATYGPVVEDVYAGRGPLGGIHAALSHTNSALNLMLAVDLPFIRADFLKYMVQCAKDAGAVVTVPKTAGGYHPLCGVYTRDFVPIAEAALKEERNKIDALFRETRTHVINEADLEKFAFDAAMFENLNTPEDWERVSRGAPLR